MCFKYEKDYGPCWDYMEFGYWGDQSGNLLSLLEEYGCRVKDRTIFFTKLFALFASLHEEGVIEPIKEGKLESTNHNSGQGRI